MPDNSDHYAPWEWQLITRMPGGCNDVIVRFADGSTTEYCSCDYWWSNSKLSDHPTHFRFR